MKKITLLGLLLLIFTSVSRADELRQLAPNEIKAGSRIMLRTLSTTNSLTYFAGTGPTTQLSSLCLFTVEDGGNGTFLLRQENASSDNEAYLQAPASAAVNVTMGGVDQAAHIQFVDLSETPCSDQAYISSELSDKTLRVCVTLSNNSVTYLNCNGAGSPSRFAAGTASWSIWNVFEIPDSATSVETVTLNIKGEDGSTWATQTANYLNGTVPTAPDVPFATCITENINPVVADGENIYDLTYRLELPFTLTNVEDGIIPDNATWYALQLPSSGFYIYYDATENRTSASNGIDWNNTAAYQWCFAGSNPYNLHIYNRAGRTIDGATVHALYTGTSFTTNEPDTSHPCIEAGEDSSWEILESGENMNLKVPGQNAYWNQHGGVGSTKVSYYSGGSGIKAIDFTTGLIEPLAQSYIRAEGHVNGWTSEQLAALTQALEDHDGAAMTEAIPALDNAERIALDPEKYYLIYSAHGAGSGKEMYLFESYTTTVGDGQNRALRWGVPDSGNIVPFLWKFTETEKPASGVDGTYYHISSPNSGNVLSTMDYTQYVGLVSADADDAGAYTLTENYDLLPGANVLQCYVSADPRVITATNANETASPVTFSSLTDLDEGGVTTWKAAGYANNWLILALNALNLSMSEAEYATLNLPFAVSLPTDLTAYYGSEVEGSEIVLQNINGTIIPAGTPVVLTGKEGNYSLTIAYDDQTAAIDGNILSGTLVPEGITTGTSAYILSNGSDGVGLYKVTSETDRTIPANKAYYEASAAQATQAFTFSFGNTTGISSANVATEDKGVYYDLSGRRVTTPRHGVYVKDNGKKVFIP